MNDYEIEQTRKRFEVECMPKAILFDEDNEPYWYNCDDCEDKLTCGNRIGV